MTEQQRAWLPREERRVRPTPTEIPAHPDQADLPPCEVGTSTDRPCPRPAKWHYGYAYYCDEHMAWVQAGEDYDAATLATHHAKRFLWRAQVEDLPLLEYHLAAALSQLEEERMAAEQKQDEARGRADAFVGPPG